jgi:hypothetical protein
VAHFDPESLAYFNPDLVAHFNPESLAHFNPESVAHFNPEYPLSQPAINVEVEVKKNGLSQPRMEELV